MKQGKPLITFVIFALAAAILFYFAYYVFHAFNEPYKTAQVYSYTAHDSAVVEGILVREEQVLPGRSGILEITRSEGEKVGKGQQVALVYRDSQAQADQAELEQLEVEIQLLEDAVSQSKDLESAARLDEDILQAVVALRSSYALGDYTQLREQASAVKSGVLKRGYTYGEGLTSAELSTRLWNLRSQLTQLSRQTAQATTRVTAPAPGLFSHQVDGYESRLTPDSLTQLTAASLQELLDGFAEEETGDFMGKLITSDTWYFAANLPQEAAQRLVQGRSATLRFSGELNRDVEMTVERVSHGGDSQDGKVLVVFSSNRYLSLITLLRHQTAELIFESWSGLRIPKEALRLEEAAGGSDSSSSALPARRTGVYALVNGRAEFREVSIVTEGSDFYVVSSVGSGRKILRAGDTVITQGTGLQDGLLLES